jgi:pimeloyl-ACP methyl ester carboxylesterase
MNDISPFRVDIPGERLEDLRRRLAGTRWPDAETAPGWTQGIPLAFMREICDHWRDGYDWRRCEAHLNAFPQFVTQIDGLDVHFIHVRSRHAGALPMLMTHGWPGSVIEFLDVIDPFADPEAHGGSASDAFDLVIPSLPGAGFSAHPSPGEVWGPQRVARAWIELMRRLGYDRWIAQGGDWGSMVSDTIGAMAPPGCIGLHLNMPIIFPTPEDAVNATPAEAKAIATWSDYLCSGSGYQQQQSTRPQTLAYGLTDSPAGQAAWILEKFGAWSDNDGDPRSAIPLDAMLDNVTLYWLQGCAGSSARLYWDTAQSNGLPTAPVDLPTGISIFPKELFRPSRRWAERRFTNIVYWHELDRGGHFAAFEEPQLFVGEMRAFARTLR